MDIGIIGGADGPMAIHVASTFGFPFGTAMAFLLGMVTYLTIKI